MKKALKKISTTTCYYFVDGKRVDGAPTGLRGNVSYLRGNVSGLRGNVTGLSGDVSDLSGNVSDLSGNVDDCGITDDERESGVNVSDLIGE
jgi:hypothetical protein